MGTDAAGMTTTGTEPGLSSTGRVLAAEIRT